MRLVLLVLFASALLLLGCAGPASAPPSGQTPAQPQNQQSATGQQPPAGSNQQPASSASIKISGFAFSPSELTVAKGATVTWTNNDGVAHTITSGSFDSGSIKNGGSFSFTFTQAGTYDYYCSIHPSMKGKITVSG